MSGVPKVLVVEDDRGVRESLQVVLQVQKYEVTGVDRGEDVISVLTTSHIDLVVLDLNLPGIDGIETCRRARAQGFRGPILMLTSNHEMRRRSCSTTFRSTAIPVEWSAVVSRSI